jgi:hypothetical protein
MADAAAKDLASLGCRESGSFNPVFELHGGNPRRRRARAMAAGASDLR